MSGKCEMSQILHTALIVNRLVTGNCLMNLGGEQP